MTDLADALGALGTICAMASATFVRGTDQIAGLYRSTDNGTTWSRLDGNLQLTRVWDITTFPDNPGSLFLSSDGDGILSVTLDDASATTTSFTISDRSGSSLATPGRIRQHASRICEDPATIEKHDTFGCCDLRFSWERRSGF